MIDADGVLTAAGRELNGADVHGWSPTDERSLYVDRDVAIGVDRDGDRTEADGADAEVRCWVLGEVFGFDESAIARDGEYVPKPDGLDDERYVRRLHERYGPEFVRGLNGSFTLLLYDRPARELSLISDRLGTVPVYYARPDGDTFVFSTDVQALPRHPTVETSFHPGYLHEYLAFRHAFGVKTPLTGVETIEPGAVTTVDLDDGSVTTSEYWRPVYRPRDEPFEWFVEEFASRFRQIMSEWTTSEGSDGVLLSGGSDSRLVLAGLEDATAVHTNDWMNREARTAERCALTADAEFAMFRRGAEYRVDALERNREHLDFIGWFTQAYLTGHESELTDRVDRLFTGLYGDTLFKRFGVPARDVSLGPVGSMTLPVERHVDSVDDYVDLLMDSAYDGFDLPTDLRETLEANIYRTDDGVVHHGVTYDSLDELAYYDSCYPLSNDNDMLFWSALRRTLPTRTPFLDNRLVDLSLSMPIRYRLRRNVVDRALERLAPELASIPHAGTGVPPSRSFAATYIGEHLRAFWRKYVSDETPPEPYMTNGSWPDDAALLRANDCFADVLEAHRETVDALPGLDVEEVREQIRAHRRGDNRTVELYTLLSVLTMPVTRDVLTEDTTDSDARTVRPPTASYEEVNGDGQRF